MWPGSWSYTALKTQQGDHSNTQYALLGLNAAAEAGVPIDPQIWSAARAFLERSQRNDGGWNYHPADKSPSYASMTCAGVSSLIITGLRRFQGREHLEGETIHDCGTTGTNLNLERASNWLARNFRVGENFDRGNQWRFYYLYGLERAGRLTGQRFFGSHDWYREGAAQLVRDQSPVQGLWRGVIHEKPVIATSFALLFLAKGRTPVLVNKLVHGPGRDWNNDIDDVRNLVASISAHPDWKKVLGNQMLTWQVVDPEVASVEDMLMAPVAFFNGHKVPVFGEEGKNALRQYVDQGGFLFAEACCGDLEFDRGFRALMREVFPEEEARLSVLPDSHPVWRSGNRLTADVHPLLGIERGCRTVVIYSPQDLSCFWNQMEHSSSNPYVIKATWVGQNVINYATGFELPADKLAVRDVANFKPEPPKLGALQIGQLHHATDWNIAPLAMPRLSESLRDKLQVDVVLSPKELVPLDPAIRNFPLVYMHGRGKFALTVDQQVWLRRHLDPNGGTLFADAACGSETFDASFRKMVAEMLPGQKLEPIPQDDDIYKKAIGYDLSKVRYSKAAGGMEAFPRLEGVKISGHWAVIYSRLDLGCALERHAGPDCKGYTPESALRIATNVVVYSTLP